MRLKFTVLLQTVKVFNLSSFLILSVTPELLHVWDPLLS